MSFNQFMEEASKTKSGIGCGTLAAILIVFVILVLVGSNAAVGYYFEHCGGEGPEPDIFECLLDQVEESEQEGAVTATGTYNYEGYSVNVSANIPLEGGAVTGTMSGTCNGKVKGNFDGQDNGLISGTITGACSPFIVNIPASAEFSGVVNKDSKTVPIQFTGRGGGLTHKDSMSLSY